MEYKKIIVFAPNKPFFGARLVQFPFFQHLRNSFPNAIIKIYSPVQEADLFLKHGLADELEVYQRSSIKNFWRLLSSVRNFNTDLIVNSRDFSEQINLIVSLSKAKVKIGFEPKSLTKFFYTKTVPYSLSLYRGSNFLNLVYLLDLPKRFDFEVIPKLGETSQLQFDRKKKNICLIPGGGEGEHKRWGIENFNAMCLQLLKATPEVHFVFILGYAEENYISIIEKNLPKENTTILFKIGIDDMVKTIMSSVAVVANDCGPSHLAQMCKVKYVGVWGWEKQDPLERIKEWVLPHDKSFYVIAEVNKSIKNVSPDLVVEKLLPL